MQIYRDISTKIICLCNVYNEEENVLKKVKYICSSDRFELK